MRIVDPVQNVNPSNAIVHFDCTFYRSVANIFVFTLVCSGNIKMISIQAITINHPFKGRQGGVTLCIMSIIYERGKQSSPAHSLAAGPQRSL